MTPEAEARELDAEIARVVFGWTEVAPRGFDWRGVAPGETCAEVIRCYSTTWEGAGLVVERLAQRYPRVEVVAAEGGFCCLIYDGDEVTEQIIATGDAEKGPEAVCRAALALAATEQAG